MKRFTASPSPRSCPLGLGLIVAALMTFAMASAAWAMGERLGVVSTLDQCYEKCQASSDPCCRARCELAYCKAQNNDIISRGGLDIASPAGGPQAPNSLHPAMGVCWDEKTRLQKCVDSDPLFYCEDYAKELLRLNKLNAKYQCNLAGDLWQGPDTRPYSRRCRQNRLRAASLSQELQSANNSIEQCRQRTNNCRKYAGLAVTMQRYNLKQGCGYKGPGWTLDAEGFFRDCKAKRLTEKQLKDDFNAKNAMIRRCSTTKQKYRQEQHQICEAYARLATSQNDKNLQLQCGEKGEKWTSDQQAYYNWCMSWKISLARLKADFNYRKKALDNCKKAKQKSKTITLAQGTRRFESGVLKQRYRKNGHDWWTLPQTVTISVPGVISVDPGWENLSRGIGCLNGGGVGVRPVGAAAGSEPGQIFQPGTYHIDFQAHVNNNIPFWCDQKWNYKVYFTPSQ